MGAALSRLRSSLVNTSPRTRWPLRKNESYHQRDMLEDRHRDRLTSDAPVAAPVRLGS